MTEPRVMVLRAAGTNCERETAFVFEALGARTTTVHINRLLEQGRMLDDFGMVVIPGGFSYGDHIAAGKVLAVELGRTLGHDLRGFVQRGGLVLGICNGFQVLVRTGLLPGPTGGRTRQATLTWNDSHRYEDRWVRLRVDRERCVMAPQDREYLSLPVAHGEGRFTVDDPADVQDLIEAHQAVFRYVSPDGGEPCYPDDPNGSMGHIAGLCDPTGQVLGLMPHPERAFFPWHHPAWTREPARAEGDGAAIIRAAVDAMR